jgi:methyl-accepting chemotaxis protein
MTAWHDRVSIVNMVTSFVVAGIAATLAVVLLVAWTGMNDLLLAQAQQRQDTNMRVAWDLLRRNGDDVQASGGALVVGGRTLTADHALVDRVTELVGGTATIFVGDVRASTSVRNADGSRAIGTRLAAGPVNETVLRDGKPYRGEAEILGHTYLTAYDPIRDRSGQVVGMLYVGLKKADFLGGVSGSLLSTAGSGAAAALVIALACWLLTRALMRPFPQLADAMQVLARGDDSVAVPYADKNNEAGAMARAIQVFQDNSRRVAALKASAEAAKVEAERRRRDELAGLAEQLDSSLGAVIRLVSDRVDDIMGHAEHMGGRIDTSTSKSIAVSDAADRTNEHIAAVSHATDQLSASARQVSAQVDHASAIAGNAAQQARGASERVNGLNRAVVQIGEVVNLITEIADQTNLLALNATIEAARAGDAGKGFAVVANEVKTLANQTARATEQIASQIAAVSEATTQVVAAISSIGGIISDVNGINSTVAAVISEQDAATRAIADKLRSAAQESACVCSNVAEITHATSASYASAIRVMWAGEDIGEPIERLNREMSAFLAKIRAA